MRALQVSEFHQLMPQESRIAISDDQVTFSPFDFNTRREFACVSSRCVDHNLCPDLKAIRHLQSSLSRLHDGVIQVKLGSMFLRAFHQEACSAWRIDDEVLRDK